MEVHLAPSTEAHLSELAAKTGRHTDELVQEAIERFVNYNEWFVRKVEKGLASADRGEFIEHEEVGRLLDARYPE